MRVCRRCGTLAAVAAEQAEPICRNHGRIDAHSYVDLDVRPGAEPVEIAGLRVEWTELDGPGGMFGVWIDGEPATRLLPDSDGGWVVLRFVSGDVVGVCESFEDAVMESFDFEVEGRREWA